MNQKPHKKPIYLIYEPFNLFISPTKYAYHVFAITSDFLDKVYAKTMLYGRCEYLLVDDFDYDTAT